MTVTGGTYDGCGGGAGNIVCDGGGGGGGCACGCCASVSEVMGVIPVLSTRKSCNTLNVLRQGEAPPRHHLGIAVVVIIVIVVSSFLVSEMLGPSWKTGLGGVENAILDSFPWRSQSPPNKMEAW